MVPPLLSCGLDILETILSFVPLRDCIEFGLTCSTVQQCLVDCDGFWENVIQWADFNKLLLFRNHENATGEKIAARKFFLDHCWNHFSVWRNCDGENFTTLEIDITGYKISTTNENELRRAEPPCIVPVGGPWVLLHSNSRMFNPTIGFAPASHWFEYSQSVVFGNSETGDSFSVRLEEVVQQQQQQDQSFIVRALVGNPERLCVWAINHKMLVYNIVWDHQRPSLEYCNTTTIPLTELSQASEDSHWNFPERQVLLPMEPNWEKLQRVWTAFSRDDHVTGIHRLTQDQVLILESGWFYPRICEADCDGESRASFWTCPLHKRPERLEGETKTKTTEHDDSSDEDVPEWWEQRLLDYPELDEKELKDYHEFYERWGNYWVEDTNMAHLQGMAPLGNVVLFMSGSYRAPVFNFFRLPFLHGSETQVKLLSSFEFPTGWLQLTWGMDSSLVWATPPGTETAKHGNMTAIEWRTGNKLFTLKVPQTHDCFDHRSLRQYMCTTYTWVCAGNGDKVLFWKHK